VRAPWGWRVGVRIRRSDKEQYNKAVNQVRICLFTIHIDIMLIRDEIICVADCILLHVFVSYLVNLISLLAATLFVRLHADPPDAVEVFN
jgi:hypothetical protein